MEVLRDYNQIVSRVDKVFNVNVQNVPILDTISYEEIKKLLDGKQINKDLNELSALAGLIFQLNEYEPALCNFIKMLLCTKHYAGIYCFLEKIFVSHIGGATFNSKNKQYSHRERFFDRFIEVVKSTQISLKDYIEFLFAILEDNDKTNLSYFVDPCLEYMQMLYRENYTEIKEFIQNNPKYKNTYYTLALEFNTQRALYEIFNSNDTDDSIFAKILKHYFKDAMTFFDKNLENAGDKKFHYVKILASIENPAVVTRLQDLLAEETNEEIKSFIKNKLGVADFAKVGISPKHFVVSAMKKIENPQERTLGVAFENLPLSFTDGSIADNVCKTHLIDIFKQEKELLNLYGFIEIKNLFKTEELSNFAEKLFEVLKKYDDIKSAKWALRFISLMANNELFDKISEFIKTLFSQNRIKEAKYFVECLIYTKNPKTIEFIKNLSEEYNDKHAELIAHFVAILGEVNQIKSLDLQDIMSTDEVNEDTIRNQTERLYKNFIANKSYSKEQFKNTFIDKKVLNLLAQNLIFGEYKQNRLLNLFVVEGQNIKYLTNFVTEQENDLVIKIAHSLDIDERFEQFVNYFATPTFTQFEKSTYSIKDSEKTLTKMSNMQGILINALKFVSNMQNFGFVKNIPNENCDATEMIHISNELGLLCEVSFESPVSSLTMTASIGNIRFYKLNQCLKNGSAYIINKANALALGSVEARYYNFVASCVSKSLRV